MRTSASASSSLSVSTPPSAFRSRMMERLPRFSWSKKAPHFWSCFTIVFPRQMSPLGSSIFVTVAP